MFPETGKPPKIPDKILQNDKVCISFFNYSSESLLFEEYDNVAEIKVSSIKTMIMGWISK